MHIAFGPNDYSRRHPCFKLGSPEGLNELRERIWSHFEAGGEGKPLEADKPGAENSGKRRFVDASIMRSSVDSYQVQRGPSILRDSLLAIMRGIDWSLACNISKLSFCCLKKYCGLWC